MTGTFKIGGTAPDTEDNLVALFTIPKEEKPYVQMAALEEGRFQEVNYLSLRTFINFSDVGKAARAAAQELDESVSMTLIGYSWLEEDKSWMVVMESGKVNVVVNSQRYKLIGSYDKAFYITLAVTGREERVRTFASCFLKHLGRDPLEGMDWEPFCEKEATTREKVLSDWKKFGKPAEGTQP